MKRIAIIAITVIVLVAMVTSVTTVLAAKGGDHGPKAGRQGYSNTEILPNGFPSGPHFNLNIHGKKWDTCQSTSEGSVFIPEYTDDKYGNATINYVTNKKKDPAGNLTVLDCCAGFDGPDDTALVQLPYDPEGYWAFARILGKPNHGKKEGEASQIILYPNEIVDACNANTTDPDFGNWTSCDQAYFPLGLIWDQYVYTPTGDENVFERFDSGLTQGKGRSIAGNITPLFTYTGWVVDASLDIYPVGTPDGQLTDCDVPGQCGTPGNATQDVIDAGKLVSYYDCDHPDLDSDPLNCNGVIDQILEWLLFKADLYAEDTNDPKVELYCVYFDNEWILNIADLVITEQDIHNDGAKLLQVRFYPRSLTVFE